MTAAARKPFLKRVSEEDNRIWQINVPCADGRRAFYKLAVHPLKEAAFRKAWKDGRTVNLSHYGDIVEVGYIANTQTIIPIISEAS
jgi:hypothetical protein